MFITACSTTTTKRREQNIHLYAAVNLKRNLRSAYCTIEATDRHKASRGLSATAGLLVSVDGYTEENITYFICTHWKPKWLIIQELSYCKQIARQLRTQYVDGIYNKRVTLKSRLTVEQGHWKWNHWIDHTRLTINQVIWRWILSWHWNVG